MKSIRLPDAIHLPSMYGGTVLLVAEDFAVVQVFRSKDDCGMRLSTWVLCLEMIRTSYLLR